MIKVKVPSLNRSNSTGGGSTFIRNLIKGEKFGYKLVEDGDYDILFIAGATLADRETVDHAEKNNKPIVLRVDNILEDSKNRNTGMPRMEEFAEKSSVVVYQTEWAKKLLSPACGDGTVILNGVDTEIFYPRKEKKTWDDIRVFYSKYSRGEGKNFNVVQYFWREYNVEKKEDVLILTGNFSKETQRINHPFEFHNNEKYEYKGILEHKALADCMRNCDVALLPYFADACSNTIIEAQACGLPVIFDHSGGTPEIIEMGRKIDFSESPVDTVNLAIGQKKDFHFEDHKVLWGVDTMNQKYYGLFNLLANE